MSNAIHMEGASRCLYIAGIYIPANLRMQAYLGAIGRCTEGLEEHSDETRLLKKANHS
jgi:hypothetical protein